MKALSNCITIFTLALLLTAVSLLGGCSTFSSKDKMQGSNESLPPVAGFADDIQDISLPTTMKWDRSKSMAIKTESFRGGVWRYTGRVEVISLKDFMVNSMQDNKWKPVGETTSKDIMLAFVKANKNCMMVISEEMFKTVLTLYVTIDKTAATGMNPFGEAVSQ